jgi:hypothetical protein
MIDRDLHRTLTLTLMLNFWYTFSAFLPEP